LSFCITNWLGAGMVICLWRGVDLHMAQLMPLPLTDTRTHTHTHTHMHNRFTALWTLFGQPGTRRNIHPSLYLNPLLGTLSCNLMPHIHLITHCQLLQ